MVLWGVHPPAYTHRSVVRTEGYTFAAETCALSLVQGPFSVAPCAKPNSQPNSFAPNASLDTRERERARESVNRSRLLSRLLCTLAGRRLLCACGTFELSFELSEHLRRLMIPSRALVWSGVSPPSRAPLTHWRHLLPRGSRWRTLCSGEREALGDAFTRERERVSERGRERERERVLGGTVVPTACTEWGVAAELEGADAAVG